MDKFYRIYQVEDFYKPLRHHRNYERLDDTFDFKMDPKLLEEIRKMILALQ